MLEQPVFNIAEKAIACVLTVKINPYPEEEEESDNDDTLEEQEETDDDDDDMPNEKSDLADWLNVIKEVKAVYKRQKQLKKKMEGYIPDAYSCYINMNKYVGNGGNCTTCDQFMTENHNGQECFKCGFRRVNILLQRQKTQFQTLSAQLNTGNCYPSGIYRPAITVTKKLLPVSNSTSSISSTTSPPPRTINTN